MYKKNVVQNKTKSKNFLNDCSTLKDDDQSSWYTYRLNTTRKIQVVPIFLYFGERMNMHYYWYVFRKTIFFDGPTRHRDSKLYSTWPNKIFFNAKVSIVHYVKLGKLPGNRADIKHMGWKVPGQKHRWR